MSANWIDFDARKGSKQPLPKERRDVLCYMQSSRPGVLPNGVAVGYLRYAAGDKDSPHFVVPGLHTGQVLKWSDCLPTNYEWPRADE